MGALGLKGRFIKKGINHPAEKIRKYIKTPAEKIKNKIKKGRESETSPADFSNRDRHPLIGGARVLVFSPEKERSFPRSCGSPR